MQPFDDNTDIADVGILVVDAAIVQEPEADPRVQTGPDTLVYVRLERALVA